MEITRRRIGFPSAWTRADFQDSQEWIYRLSESDLGDLDRMLAAVRGRPLQSLRQEDVPLGGFADVVAATLADLEGGRGFRLLRGIPVHTRYTEQDAATVHWAIGLHMGRPVPQNRYGHMLGHIRNEGVPDKQHEGYTERSYGRASAAAFHTDRSDIVGLMCLRQAMEGGESLLVSSMTLHNVVLTERPDLLDVLYERYFVDLVGDEVHGQPPYFPARIFSCTDGVLSVRTSTRRIRSAQRFAELPRLTQRQLEAFDFLDSLPRREELQLSMHMQPGDIQWINNYTTTHSRTQFRDHDDPVLRRHLLRLWITLYEGRPLCPELARQREGVELADTVVPVASMSAA